MMKREQKKPIPSRPVLLVVTASSAVLREANRERQKTLLKLDNNGIDLSKIDMIVAAPSKLQDAIATFHGSVSGVIVDSWDGFGPLADSMEMLTECVAFSLTSGACSITAKAVKDKMASICGERFVPQWSAKLTKKSVDLVTKAN